MLGVVVQRPAEEVVGLIVVERWGKCMEEVGPATPCPGTCGSCFI